MRQISLLLITFFSMPFWAQCTSGPEKTLPLQTLSDKFQHSSENHHVTAAPAVSCTYTTDVRPNCNTTCFVHKSGGTITSETGTLNVAGTHQVSVGWADEESAAT